MSSFPPPSDVASTWIVVAAVIVGADGKIMVVRRGEGMAHAGLWELPGGKVEQGESLAVALQREIREELSLNIHVGNEVFSETLEVEGRRIQIHFLRAAAVEGEKPNLMEHSAIRWEDATTLGSLELAPGDVAFAKWAKENRKALI